MEGLIATWYARNTRRDLRGYRKCADAVAARLAPGARVLEVAAGPGYLAVEIARRGPFRVGGLDISETFVRLARAHAREEGVTVDFQHGNASRMPYANESFDYVVCRAAFKNFTDPLGALDEMHRVLAPGGEAAVYDLRKEATGAEIDAEVAGMGLSRLDALLTRWIFRATLLKNAYGEPAIEGLARQSRFGGGTLRRDGIGFELRLVKR